MAKSWTPTSFWIALIAVLGFAGSASAQTPSFGVGYQLLHLPDNWVNAGFNLDVEAPLNDQLGIVGEFGLGHQGSSGSDPVKATLYHFGGGVRWSWVGERIRPFAQALAGAEVTSAEIPTVGGGTFDDSDTAFMLQLGGGVYVPVGPRWGVVGQADLRPVFFDGDTDNQFRFVFGARFSLR